MGRSRLAAGAVVLGVLVAGLGACASPSAVGGPAEQPVFVEGSATGEAGADAGTDSTPTDPTGEPAAASADGAATAASGTTGPSADAVPTDADGPVVDYASGTILTAAERFGASPTEKQEVAYARAVLVQQCEQKAGYFVPRRMPPPTLLHSDTRYGIWIVEQAETAGYARYLTADEQQYLQDKKEGQLPEQKNPAPAEVRAACRAEGADMVRAVTATLTLPETRKAALTSADGAAILTEWRSCLTAAGVALPRAEYGLYPAGATRAVNARNIATAVADAGCKKQVDYVNRMAAVESEEQADFLDHNRADLAAQRARVDQALVQARRIVQEYEASTLGGEESGADQADG